jgi:hypothetical protein
MGKFVRGSLPFSRTDIFIGPDSLVSSLGKNDRRKQGSISDYVHIVANSGAASSCSAAEWKQHLPNESGSRAAYPGTAPGRARRGRGRAQRRRGGGQGQRRRISGLGGVR